MSHTTRTFTLRLSPAQVHELAVHGLACPHLTQIAKVRMAHSDAPGFKAELIFSERIVTFAEGHLLSKPKVKSSITCVVDETSTVTKGNVDPKIRNSIYGCTNHRFTRTEFHLKLDNGTIIVIEVYGDRLQGLVLAHVTANPEQEYLAPEWLNTLREVTGEKFYSEAFFYITPAVPPA